jgi:hypothetical protein
MHLVQKYLRYLCKSACFSGTKVQILTLQENVYLQAYILSNLNKKFLEASSSSFSDVVQVYYFMTGTCVCVCVCECVNQ